MTTMRSVIAAALVLAVAGSGRAAPPAGVLEAAGGRLAGNLVPAAAAAAGVRDTLLWRSPRFAEPFEFRVGEVAGIAFAVPQEPAPAGPFVHLRGGDVFAAAIESLDADALVTTVAGPDGPQRLRIARGEVAAVTRGNVGVGSYVGPGGLAGWQTRPEGSWREAAGRISTEQAGACVIRDVGAPARACYDIRLSRRKPAEFRIAVGAAEADKPQADAYVLQAVGGDAAGGGMMLVRRAGGRAAIEVLPGDAWRGDALRVVLFVDQESGRLAAVLPDAGGGAAGRVTEVTMKPAPGEQPSGRFRIELTAGDISLDRLQVDPWRAAEPTLRAAAETTIVARGGPLDGFTVNGYDAAKGEWALARDGESRQVAAADVDEIRFPEGGAAGAEPALRAVRADGGSFAGDLVKVDDRAVWLRRRGVEPDVAVPLASLAALRSLRPAGRRGDPAGRVGTLVAGDDRVRGWLAPGPDGGPAWRPLGSVTAAGFAVGEVDAEVEYVARTPDRKAGEVAVGGIGGLVNRDAEGFYAVMMLTDDGAAARDGRIQPGDRVLAISPSEKARFVETKDLDQENVTHLLRGRLGTIVRLKVVDGANANPRQIDLTRGPINVASRDVLDQAIQAHARLAGADDPGGDPRAAYPSLVVLRSGDVAPCRIDSIDARSLLLRSPLAEDPAAAVRVAADVVKAVELIPSAAPRNLLPAQRDRLLTLPRMQRDQPPTHLLRLVDGDYLRGRLLGMDDKAVTFEVRDVVKQLSRPQVARIIWLHPAVPAADGAEPPAVEPPPAEEGLVAQGVAVDGRRMTLVAEGVEGDSLRGTSLAFGASTIDLRQTDRLLLGRAVARNAKEIPFAQWTLKPAPEPKALSKPGVE